MKTKDKNSKSGDSTDLNEKTKKRKSEEAQLDAKKTKGKKRKSTESTIDSSLSDSEVEVKSKKKKKKDKKRERKNVKHNKDKKSKEDAEEQPQEKVTSTTNPTPNPTASNGEHSDESKKKDSFMPYETFQEANLPKSLVNYCLKNFEKPTKIQSHCWPILMARRDVIAIAETGSGKTLAFLMPILVHVQKLVKQKKKPLALVIAPTRELAMQTATVCNQVEIDNITSLCLYGGVPKDTQRLALKRNPTIIIATPGRLLDFITEGSCVLDAISTLILDEADRMLDAGFEKDIMKIISFLPVHPTRQTAVFSATWPPEIRTLGNSILSNPISVSLNRNMGQSLNGEPSDSFSLAANHSVKQIVEVISDAYAFKDKKLNDLLTHYQIQHKKQSNDSKPWKVLIFVLYKKDVSRVENYLYNHGWTVVSIHGDMSQIARFHSLEQFKNGSCPLLLATDVAARGLDIPDVSVVINYSFPLTIADYIHRIGRTGRAGNTGVSHTLFTSFDRSHSGELINVLKQANQVVPPELLKFGTTIKKKEHPVYGAHFKSVSESIAPQRLVFDD